MYHCLAMAGFAEAAEFYTLIIFSGALLITAGLLALAWCKRWLLAAVPAAFICVLIGVVLRPWQQFAPLISNDPDEYYWVSRWRGFALCWIALCAAALTCIFALLRDLKSTKAPQPV